ncbi:MAG: class I SAM-dependent methyltransferase [Sporichthyaceae bacterium]|nr:class I SAM-dependent methyltransferase [Sporichthyaceae bacterium]
MTSSDANVDGDLDIDIADPRLEQYAAEHTTPEPPWFAALAEETRAATRAPSMMVGTLEGRFLAAIVAMLCPRNVLEIGTFTGYSALSMAEALPPDGRIVTCDISEEHVAIARRHIGSSPFADRIEIRVGPAIETIATLPGPFDLVFIDADKGGYLAYYEATLPKLAPEGLIVVDNVLWSGRLLAPPESDDADTRAIRDFNDRLVADSRVDVVMLTVRDGVSLVRHRRAAPAG